ncbi:MAG: ABC transporter substrate-binding protein [Actinomycetota bacterium]
MKALSTYVARLAAVALVVGVAAFGAPGGAGADRGEKCPVKALDRAEKSVEITFWHVQQAKNEEVLLDLIEQFEASQHQVRVKLVNVPTYPDIFEKYRAGLATGDLPDLVQMDESALQSLVDSKSTIPVQACVKADSYSLEDFAPHAIDYYTTEGVLRAMPWTVSNPVLLYDKNDFRAAGLDPEQPPQTLDEVTEYSRKIVEAGAAEQAIALRAEALVNESLYAKSGEPYLNNRNGRDGRATKTLLETEAGLDIWKWWDGLVESDLGYFTGSEADNVDNLYALGTGDAAMTIDVSTVIGSVFAVLESGQFADVDLGVGPLPGLQSRGGVPVADGSLWIPQTGSPERTAAAWELIKFLSAPEQQAAFAVGSRGGYVPIRISAVEDPALQAMWTDNPELMVPYEQFQAGGRSSAAIGAVTGDFAGVRAAVRDALTAMFIDGMPPEKALARAQHDATEAIQEYNDRVGV